jgi:membrane fusion protein (multidrug efflux system)
MNPSVRPPSASPPGSAPLPLGRYAAVALVLVALAAVAGMLPRWRARAALNSETAELAVPTVAVISPVRGKASAPPTYAAEVRPMLEAPIYARASGYLKRWFVDLGGKVESGQVLAEIDTPELNQELARSRAELAQSEAALALSRATAARWAQLLKAESVSAQEAAEKQTDVAYKTASVEAARANVRRLEELQSFQKVTAPFAGVITARRTDVGELVSATAGRELFRLVQARTLRVFVRVPQSLARAVVVGQAAELTVPEIPGRIFPVKVVRTSGAMDPTSRTLLTELEADNAKGELLAGSYAQVRFPHAQIDAALTLPATTLLFRSAGVQVGLVGPDNRVVLRNLTLGRDFGPTVEVLAGAGPNDRVIVNPPDSLVDGTLVRVAVAAPAPGAK